MFKTFVSLLSGHALCAFGRQKVRTVFITTDITVTFNYTLGHHPQLGLYFAHDGPEPSACTTKHWLQNSSCSVTLLSVRYRTELHFLAVCQISDRTALPSDIICWTAKQVQQFAFWHLEQLQDWNGLWNMPFIPSFVEKDRLVEMFEWMTQSDWDGLWPFKVMVCFVPVRSDCCFIQRGFKHSNLVFLSLHRAAFRRFT